MNAPEPLVVSWQGRVIRVRHDDPHLSPYSPNGATIRSAIELASDLEGLRLVLASTVGDRYDVHVAGDWVGLRRRPRTGATPAGSTGTTPGPYAR